MKNSLFALSITLLCIAAPSTAYAGDGVTLVMKSGAVIFMRRGYDQIAAGIREYNSKSNVETLIKQIKIEEGTFYINLNEIAIACRDHCRSLEITPPRKPK